MTVDQDDEIERIEREFRAKLEEQVLRTYGPAVTDHWLNPRNFRAMEAPDGYAKVTGPCGDTMEMFLRVENGTIVECTFQTDGCGTTVVCGSVATMLAAGRPFNDALGMVSSSAILRVLGGLPEDSVHCAELAAGTLRRALADGLHHQSASWKKGYRKT